MKKTTSLELVSNSEDITRILIAQLASRLALQKTYFSEGVTKDIGPNTRDVEAVQEVRNRLLLQSLLEKSYVPGNYNNVIQNKIRLALEKKKEFKELLNKKIAVFNGFVPLGTDGDDLMALMGIKHEDPNQVFEELDIDGFFIMWDKMTRNDDTPLTAEKQKGFSPIKPILDIFKLYKEEYSASDLMSGSPASTEVFSRTIDYLQNHPNLDTLMAYSTGGKVLLTFLRVMGDVVFGSGSETPENIKKKFGELESQGFNGREFIEKIFSRIKVIQFVRINAQLEDVEKLHPHLVEMIDQHGISLVNYYDTIDMTLKAAEFANEGKDKTIGRDIIIPANNLPVLNILIDEERNMHAEALSQKNFNARYLLDRDILLTEQG